MKRDDVFELVQEWSPFFRDSDGSRPLLGGNWCAGVTREARRGRPWQGPPVRSLEACATVLSLVLVDCGSAAT